MDREEIRIEHIFNAPREKVWEAWTSPEIIKKWWGPEGFSAPSIEIDFNVGGRYIYAMQGPKGSEWDRVMYSSGVFKEIVPNEKIVVTDYFSDKDGNKIEPSKEGQSADFPEELTVTILFEELEPNKTKLLLIYPRPESDAQFQAMLNSGMTEGWGQSLDKLELALKGGDK